jgi:hypothetical protein
VYCGGVESEVGVIVYLGAENAILCYIDKQSLLTVAISLRDISCITSAWTLECLVLATWLAQT